MTDLATVTFYRRKEHLGPGGRSPEPLGSVQLHGQSGTGLPVTLTWLTPSPGDSKDSRPTL